MKRIPQNMVFEDGTAINRAKVVLLVPNAIRNIDSKTNPSDVMSIEELPTECNTSVTQYTMKVDKDDKELEEDVLGEEILVKIKYRVICHVVSARDAEINYAWLKEIAKENFPLWDNDFCFGWKINNQDKGYISDEEEFSYSIKEMKRQGKSVMKYEVITTKSMVTAAKTNRTLKEQKKL